MTRTVHIIPHTHWDREWYRTFQSFRMELVDLVDETIAILEGDPGFSHFMLDGQMAVIDDFLEIRPTHLARLGRLGESGRLVMGPWYILMDEFGVSGETIVRNMEMGLDRAEDFGGAMPVGYLPDMFGHIAQMPQILEQFGFADTVVWRGVPAACTTTPAFTWRAPNGSAVRAQYLPWGYGNGVGLPPDAGDLVRRAELFCERAGSAAGTGDHPVLWMHGTDHRHPLRELPEMVAEANLLTDNLHFVVSTLPAYIAEQRATGDVSSEWTGELRSGARANLLMGVTSNRVDVKQAAARAEHDLERLAEPLCALFGTPESWPSAFLSIAWKLMVHNSAHDSICACSHDDVVISVLDRFAQADAIATNLVERTKIAAFRRASGCLADAPLGSAIVVNPTARTRSGLVELQVPVGAKLEGTQELWELPKRLPFVTHVGQDAMGWFDVVDDQLGDVHDVVITSRDDAIDVDLITDVRRFGLLDPSGPRAELSRLVTERPDTPVHFHYVGHGEHRVLAYADAVPGFGWARWTPQSVDKAVTVDDDGHGMKNAHIHVRVAPDGTFAINDHGGLGQIVDDGDRGDTYNFCPIDDDVAVTGFDSVRVEVLETGPLRARLRIIGQALWPERHAGGKRTGSISTTVSTELCLTADQRFVQVTTRLDNRSRDHRVRVWFPLPEPADHSEAECAFGVTKRGLHAEGGPSEPALATWPSRRFVSAGGLSIAHVGLNEYELVDLDGTGDNERARAIAITLLRATGMLSQTPMPSRPLPAGPFDPAEGAQLQGRREFRYAVHIGDADGYQIFDDAFTPLVVAGSKLAESATAPAATSTLNEECMLDVSGAQVSALRRLDDDPTTLELRVFNPTDEPTVLTVANHKGVRVNLKGDELAPFDGTCELSPWEIATLHLDY